ncbi:hypothetical protein JCM5350_005213 [Sporobolomyces pararoseus]
MGDIQHLVDRLVVATEEQDVLWVLVTIGEMKELNCLEMAIDATHSWKGYSPLESIARLSSLSVLHKHIAQLLLLSGAHQTLEEGEEIDNAEAQAMILTWESIAQNAHKLLSIDISEAADWIDLNLPPPPNPENLTGEGPLPAPPTALLTSAAEKEDVSSSIASSDKPLHQHSSNSTTETSFNSLPRQGSQYSQLSSYPYNDKTAELYFTNLPPDITSREVDALFAQNGVKVGNLRFRSGRQQLFGFAEVQLCDVEYSVECLNKVSVRGYDLICQVANSSAPHKARRSPSSSSSATLPFNSTYDRFTLSHTSNLAKSATHTTAYKVKEEEVPSNNLSSFSAELPQIPSISSVRANSTSTLHLVPLPSCYEDSHVHKLFVKIGVVPLRIFVRRKAQRSFAFVDVEPSQARYCINTLHLQTAIDGHLLNCSTSKARDSSRPSSSSPDRGSNSRFPHSTTTNSFPLGYSDSPVAILSSSDLDKHFHPQRPSQVYPLTPAPSRSRSRSPMRRPSEHDSASCRSRSRTRVSPIPSLEKVQRRRVQWSSSPPPI